MGKAAHSMANLHAGAFRWSVLGYPKIILHSRTMDGILHDAMDVFIRVPRRGAETGGILLGRRTPDAIVIEDFAPVPSEHRFGRLYRLSEIDRTRLREACDATARSPGGLEPVGLYRSHAREDPGATDEDAEYVADHFAEGRRVLLLVRPGVTSPSTASIFFWSDGRFEEPLGPAPFPFVEMPGDSSAPASEGPPPAPVDPPSLGPFTPPDLLFAEIADRQEPRPQKPPAIARPIPAQPAGPPPGTLVDRLDPISQQPPAMTRPFPARPVTPAPGTHVVPLFAGAVDRPDTTFPKPPAMTRPFPTRPVVPLSGTHVEPPEPAPPVERDAPMLLAPAWTSRGSRKRVWVVAAALIGAVAVGYYFYRQQPPTLDMSIVVPPSNASPLPPLQSTPAVVGRDSPAPQLQPASPAPAVESRDRQESPRQPIEVRAVLDRWADAIRRGRVDAAAAFYAPAVRERARARIRAMLGAARRMDVFRLSGTTVVYPAPGEAEATLRQNWQSGVAAKTAGEQGMRIALRAHRDGLQIVSEQVEQVHWVQKVQ